MRRMRPLLSSVNSSNVRNLLRLYYGVVVAEGLAHFLERGGIVWSRCIGDRGRAPRPGVARPELGRQRQQNEQRAGDDKARQRFAASGAHSLEQTVGEVGVD